MSRFPLRGRPDFPGFEETSRTRRVRYLWQVAGRSPWLLVTVALLVVAPMVWEAGQGWLPESPWSGASRRETAQLLLTYYTLILFFVAAVVALAQLLDATQRREAAEVQTFLLRYNVEEVLIPLWCLTDEWYPRTWTDFRSRYGPETKEHYFLARALNFLNEYCGHFRAKALNPSVWGSLDSAMKAHGRAVLSYVLQRRADRSTRGDNYRFSAHHGENIEEYMRRFYPKIYSECLDELKCLRLSYRTSNKSVQQGREDPGLIVELTDGDIEQAKDGIKPGCEPPPGPARHCEVRE